MLKILNHNHKEFNIAHFQGGTCRNFSNFFEYIKNRKIENFPKDITILSIWTDDNKCILQRQLNTYEIQVINCYIQNNDKWTNPYKIKCIYNALKNIQTKYILILDGYDVLIYSWNNIIEKFKSFNTGIVFNTTKNNYPEYYGDISNKQYTSSFKYLNAGCCIGYKDALINFYEQTNNFYQNQPMNKWNSEQYIIRNIFSKYCNYNQIDYNLVKLDTECIIFQTFGQIKYKQNFNGDFIIY